MSIATSDVVDAAVLQGFQEGISVGLGLIPEAGPFLQLIFGHIWELAFAERTAAQKKAAMDSLFESVGKMIKTALAESVADQARAYNASIAQLGQDYRVSVQAFQDNNSALAVQKVVVRFENCKSTLVHMLNLFAQPSYMKHTVLSYGSALAMYVGLVREMMLAGQDCGYSTAEITDFRNDINDHIMSAYQQVFMNNRAALHVYVDVDTELQLSRFTVEETMNVKLRAYYLVDYKDYDSSDVEVTISTNDNPKVHQFHLNKREKTVVSFPWVKLYYSNTEGGAWSTDYDKFSTDMRMHYDEYEGFEPQKGTVYNIKTKAGSSSTTNYYIIGFEIVPTSGVPDVL